VSKEMQHVLERFDNIHQLLSTTRTRPVNKHFVSNRSSMREDYHWYKTNSLPEAEELLLKGWDEHKDDIMAAIKASDKVETATKLDRVNIRNNVVGASPNVPRAILGLPDSMIEYNRTPSKQRTMQIGYGISASASVGADELVACGCAVLALVNHIERMGIRVRLDIFESSVESLAGGGNISMGWRLCLKDYRQPFDLLKMAFPVAHPSMLRRISFAWMETHPQTPPSFVSGYGMPIHHHTECRTTFLDMWKGEDAKILFQSEVSRSKNNMDRLMEIAGIIVT
jgi:hypothetical protein